MALRNWKKLERNWKSMYRRIKVIPYLSPVKTINSK
jgi:hypothetical protein